MIKQILTAIILITLIGCSGKQNSKRTSVEKKDRFVTNKPQITLLGTFHFAGTSDYSSVKFDALDSEKRQKEIREIIDKLKPFNPTKILVEFPSNKSKIQDSLYAAYRNGYYKLTINEIDQIGFRMANELNHDSIYSIDYKLNLPFNELINFAEKHNKTAFNLFLKSVKEQDKFESEYLAKHSLLDYLIYRNSNEEDIRNKDQYLNKTAKFVNDTSYIGAEFAAKWWERNIMMMSNIDQVTQKNDRLLVIVGAAHRAILKDFFEDRTDVEYVEISNFLKN